MKHKWFLSSDTDNLKKNLKLIRSALSSDSYDKKKDTLVFSHVQKAAGTSFESVLAKNFLLSEVLHINAPDLNKLPTMLNLKKQPPKLICGHHPLHGILYQLLKSKSIYHITMLREPISRILSFYNYIKERADHPLHSHTKSDSLLAFMDSCPSPELTNGQAKRFSGHLHDQKPVPDSELFQIAQVNLSKYFSAVFTSCLFDESLLLLKKELKLKDIYYQKQNVSKKFITYDQLTDEDLQFIQSKNQADLKLYNWVKSKLSKIINEKIPQESIDLFKTKNSQWNQLING